MVENQEKQGVVDPPMAEKTRGGRPTLNMGLDAFDRPTLDKGLADLGPPESLLAPTYFCGVIWVTPNRHIIMTRHPKLIKSRLHKG